MKFGITNVYPVPVSNILNFSVNSKEGGPDNVNICDATGHQVINESISVNVGEKQLTYNVEQLGAGTYFITLTSDKFQVATKFIKQ